ncbi:MAG: rubrerythrin [Desulfurivibrio sp.]|jgi:rubrerythrin|nr:MAG: rubrerythrin [Desulfurivibrio sp.]
MGFEFIADEIFEMAEQVEKNGAKFYRMAAEKVNGDERKILLELAGMEDCHGMKFADFRKALALCDKNSTTFDPDGETALHLKTLSESRGFFEKDLDISDKEAILKSAITVGKESIIFYLGLKDLVDCKAGKEKIDAIINEEMRHLKLLNGRLHSSLR